MNRQNIPWIIFLVAMAIAGVTYSFSLPTNSEDISYLLSALSQGLAAIFALVFTITIFGAEMQRKFTALDKMIDKWTILLMILFAIGIILPLLQLRTDMNLVNLDIINNTKLVLSFNLGIATFCILAIIPYLMRINRLMKYEGGILKLHEDALNAIDLNRTATSIFKIHELGELFFNASNDDLKFKAIIIKKIGDIGEIAIDKKSELLTLNISNILGNIGVKAVDKKLTIADYPIAEEAIIRLKENCIYAIKNDLNEKSVYNSSEYLLKIGYKYLLKNIVKHDNYSSFDEIEISKFRFFNRKKKIVRWEIPNYLVLNSLLEITEAINDKLCEDEQVKFYLRSIKSRNDFFKLSEYKFGKTLVNSMIFIWVLSAFVVRHSPEKAQSSAYQIKFSEHNVIKNLFESKICHEAAANFIHKQFISQHNFEFKDLEQDLGEFIKIYESC